MATTTTTGVPDGRRGPGPAPRKRRRGRRPTLYDAVAGLIRSRVPRTADGSVSERLVLAPDEAVFRARNAPPRFEETDRYFAHEGLPAAGAGDGERVLPDGDLLAAVHRYASQFYEEKAEEEDGDEETGMPKRRLLDERSMDETALLAMGILLEEACRGLLGRQGELVFTEGGEEEEGDEEDEEEEEDGEEEDEGDDEEEDEQDDSSSSSNSSDSDSDSSSNATDAATRH